MHLIAPCANQIPPPLVEQSAWMIRAVHVPRKTFINHSIPGQYSTGILFGKATWYEPSPMLLRLHFVFYDWLHPLNIPNQSCFFDRGNIFMGVVSPVWMVNGSPHTGSMNSLVEVYYSHFDSSPRVIGHVLHLSHDISMHGYTALAGKVD